LNSCPGVKLWNIDLFDKKRTDDERWERFQYDGHVTNGEFVKNIFYGALLPS
jgi:hypothetical protein